MALATPSTVTKPLPSNQAVVSLVSLSQNQREAGKLDAAAATLERALRVDPRNAELWYQLAELRFAQSRSNQAIQLAVKSNTFAVADRSLQAKNWQLIGRVKEKNGDSAGAQDAYGRANSLEP